MREERDISYFSFQEGIRYFMVSTMAVARKLVLALAIISVSLGGNWVGAQVHHVVGGDRGWDLSSGVGSWSSGRTFSVGDKLCMLSLFIFMHSILGGRISKIN